MKCALFLSVLVMSLNVFAGNGDFGSVGGTKPSSVRSTSNKIQTYNSQKNALSIKDVCVVVSVENPRLDWGKYKGTFDCATTRDGLIELRGISKGVQFSVFANPSDMTVLEYNGETEVYRYTNDLGQYIVISMSFVNERIKRGIFGTIEQVGKYRPDIMMGNESVKVRAGYYANL